MNKDEILAKSRQENEGFSEHDQFVKMKAADFSTGVLIFTWLVLGRMPIDLTAKLALAVLVQVTCLGNFGYQWAVGKRKVAIVFTLLFTATSGFFIYQFLQQLQLWPF